MQHHVLLSELVARLRPSLHIVAQRLLTGPEILAVDPAIGLRRAVIVANGEQADAEKSIALDERCKGRMRIGQQAARAERVLDLGRCGQRTRRHVTDRAEQSTTPACPAIVLPFEFERRAVFGSLLHGVQQHHEIALQPLLETAAKRFVQRRTQRVLIFEQAVGMTSGWLTATVEMDCTWRGER